MASRGRGKWKKNKEASNCGLDNQEQSISPALIKQARHSGQLNLSNRGLTEIPQKVWRINIDVPDDGKEVALDSGSSDRWWEQTDLRKLILASNQLTSLSSDIKHLSALTVLDVHDNQLNALPEELGQLVELSKMHLSHNKLSSLPMSLGDMLCLQVILLSNNLIEDLSEDFGNLSHLEELDLSSNKLSILPKSFGNLRKLRKLNLSDNKLEELPMDMKNMCALQDLNLQSNKLTMLPCGLENMMSLNIMDCRSNFIKSLPFLEGTVTLKEIYLGNNRITHLNPEIFKFLPFLVILDVKDNTIQSVPEEISLLVKLERLDLRNNCISGLPTVMGNMESIKSVSLDGNPLRGIRRDIIAKGTQSLLSYLKSRIVTADAKEPKKDDAVNQRAIVGEINDNIVSLEDDRILRQMCATKKIDWSNKKATSIPDVYFVENQTITSVDFSKNILDQVPIKLTIYSQCLTELNLNSNRLTEIPGELSELFKLQFLDLGNNMISSLPEECRSWKSLVQIIISGNRFQDVPEILYDIPSLEILLATSNQVSNINVNGLLKLPRIANLDLSNNSILNVPPELGNVLSLKSLHIEGNPFRSPRHAVLLKGTPHLLEYLRSRIPR